MVTPSYDNGTGGVGIGTLGIGIKRLLEWLNRPSKNILTTEITAANVTSLYNEVQCVPAIIPSDYFNPVIIYWYW